ncbi:MAG: hypothetical protein EI684_04725, partial [Candidatus Viridilinea halotolerans]
MGPKRAPSNGEAKTRGRGDAETRGHGGSAPKEFLALVGARGRGGAGARGHGPQRVSPVLGRASQC